MMMIIMIVLINDYVDDCVDDDDDGGYWYSVQKVFERTFHWQGRPRYWPPRGCACYMCPFGPLNVRAKMMTHSKRVQKQAFVAPCVDNNACR